MSEITEAKPAQTEPDPVSEKEVMFQKNLNEDTSKMAVAREELEGMPNDFIDGS